MCTDTFTDVRFENAWPNVLNEKMHFKCLNLLNSVPFQSDLRNL